MDVRGDGTDIPDDQMIDDIYGARSTVHADDAVDYEDIDELADMDSDGASNGPGDGASQSGAGASGQYDNGGIGGDQVDDGGDLDAQAQANQEFEDMFGDGPGMAEDLHGLDLDVDLEMAVDHNRLLAGGLENDHLLDDGLGGIMEMYGDDADAGPGDGPVDGARTHEDLAVASGSNSRSSGARARASARSPSSSARSTAALRAIVARLEVTQTKRNLRYFCPGFKRGRPYNNHKLFLPEAKYYRHTVPPVALKPKLLVPKVTFEVDYDQRRVFKTNKYPSHHDAGASHVSAILEHDLLLLEKIAENHGVFSRKLVPLPYLTKDGSGDNQFGGYGKDLVVATADWDDEAIIDGTNGTEGPSGSANGATNGATGAGAGARASARAIGSGASGPSGPTDVEYDDDDIFSGQVSSPTVQLDMNDPNLLFERAQPPTSDKSRASALVPITDKMLQARFNVSNDTQYELFNSNYNVKVRSQIGNLNIEHSVPALRLQSPHYRVKLTKEEARAFHRPKFQVRPGSLMSFLKLRARKRKKDKGKTPKELFSRTTDLTGGDNSTIIGMEYAEEYPMVLSKFGMGSKLINYYRRERPDDNSRPKAPLGETHVLGVEDRSPFWNFGHVAKGDFVPTIYNNMIRAPIFKHEKKATDFLLIKSQGGGTHQRYYLRNLDHVFGVGHSFPSVEVPAPHSRKVTNTSKNRLKMVVFRTMNKKGKARILVRDISHHFPDQNDMQNRQRLKEFMEYQRQGEDQGFWKIKNRDTVPSEESVRSMISPEDISLLDSMQAGQQLLEDLGILLSEEQEKERALALARAGLEKDKDLAPEKDPSAASSKDKKKRDKKEKEEEEGIDDQLTSWNLSRNFILANQTKSMLQLTGEGDPTGIGIGFSFLKTSQKSAFTPFYPPPKENVPKSSQAAYQQRIYDEEINRIWYTQRKSLTVDGAGRSLGQIYNEYKPVDHQKVLRKKYDEANADWKGKKALKIHRRFRDENGTVQRRVEVVSDPRLIKAYLKRKKQIEDDLIKNTNLEDIIPTNDKELNKIRRKALEEKLANLERRAKHNKGRKPAVSKDPLHNAIAAGGKAIDANTVLLPDGSYAFGGKGIGKGKSTTRRCAACGAFGHIRTKKSCPLYSQTQGGKIDITTNKPFSLEKTVFESGEAMNLDFD